MLPDKDHLTLCFAHSAYRLADRFALRGTGIKHFEVRGFDELQTRLHEADVLVVSGLWKNELIDHAPNLRFIQSISAGTDQFSKPLIKERGIRLASASGVNARAVAEHAIALMLALSRRLLEARDNQHKHHWRGMIGDLSRREDELGGKTVLVVGMGTIGHHFSTLARAFGMKVIGIRRHPEQGANGADSIHSVVELTALLPHADYVVLTCALTPDTEGLINQAAFAAMKPQARLINVARGRVVDEPALIRAMQQGLIDAAGLDVCVEEPLPATSSLWDLPNALITPHSAGETRRYEDNVLDVLMGNLDLLWKNDANQSVQAPLRNQIV
jgi:phosphoglycerate dehydrogenase-like enzyme